MPQASPLSQIKDRFPDAVLDITEFANERILHIKGEHILTVLSGLKADGYGDIEFTGSVYSNTSDGMMIGGMGDNAPDIINEWN